MTKEMNLIFDLQLFTDNPVKYTDTSGNEEIKIFQSNGKNTVTGTATNWKPDAPEDVLTSVDASGGNDTITVAATASGLVIMPGEGNDYVTIDGGSTGNTFFFKGGRNAGNDTIEGWDATKDTLQVSSALKASAMSSDGKDLLMSLQGGGTLRIKGIAPTTPTEKTIKLKIGNNVNIADAATNHYVPFAMDGTDENDLIENTVTGSTEAKAGTAANSALTISGGKGADTIINEGKYVYIDGGKGNDSIVVRALGGAANASKAYSDDTVTAGVTINAGTGNDIINLMNDVGTVAAVTDANVNPYVGNGNKTVKAAAHVIEFNPTTDGMDSIYGLSAADTIVLTGGTFTNDDAIKNAFSVDKSGNLNFKSGSGKLTFIDAVPRMFGKTFHIFYDNGTNTADYAYEVPKESIASDYVNEINATTVYSGFNYSLAGGNDTITISGATIYADGGKGDDYFTLTGGTNLIKSGEETVRAAGAVVTIYGGIGQDQIHAENDKQGETLASHVYRFGLSEGKDTIWGFNENDTIQINDNSVINENGVKLSGFFSSITGNFILKITDGKGAKATTVELVDYKGGSKLNIGMINDAKDAYTIPAESYFGDGITAHTVTEGAETKIDYYEIEKQAAGTQGNDTLTISAADNNFTINLGDGNDTVTIQGASTVSVSGGKGDDKIYITKGTIMAGNPAAVTDKYSRDLTIYGGAGDDTIYAEIIGAGTANNPTGTDYQNAKPKIYQFGKDDGNDVIIGFNESDTIQIAKGSTAQVSVDSSNGDALVVVGKSTIRLVGYAAHLDTFAAYVNISQQKDDGTYSAAIAVAVPKYLKGTKGENTFVDGNDNFTTKIKADGYTIEADDGNDQINSAHNQLVIDAGKGNDQVTITGNEVSIDAGAGNDIITLGSTASDITIKSGTGKDTIYGAINGKAGNVYEFATGQGTNYIVNFRPDIDTIKGTAADAVSNPEVTKDGLKLKIGTTIVYLRGVLKAGVAPGSSDLNNYEMLEGDSNIIVNNAPQPVARMIVGTSKDDTLANTLSGTHQDLDNYTIKADDGADIIWGGGNNISISAGKGNDTIYLTTDSNNIAKNSTINAGTDKNIIVGNGLGHVYEYGGGYDTIYGFTANDSIDVGTRDYKGASVTADGVYLKIGTNSKAIFLKGENTVGSVDNSTNVEAYKLLEPGSALNIIHNGSLITNNDDATVPKKLMGTTSKTAGDSLTNEVSGDEEDYLVIEALAGDDTIKNSGSNVSINGGANDDVITIEGGSNVIVYGGTGADTINVTDTSGVGHVFEVKAGEGNKLIRGFGANDTIHILGKATTEDKAFKKAQFATITSAGVLSSNDNAFVITIDDSTQITLLGAEDTENSGEYKSIYENKKFYMQYGGNAEAVEYEIPKVISYDSSNNITVPSSYEKGFKVLGTASGNTLNNDGADDLYISLGAGNDTITIASGLNNTINPGTGNDYVTLSTTGHVYEYANKDGNDTILGWDSNDTLKISGATSITTLMSSVDSGNGVGKDFQLKFGTQIITFQDTAEDAQIKVYNANTKAVSIGSGNDITVIAKESYGNINILKLIIGTTSGETIKNTRIGYSIKADSGNDTIENDSADNVSIDAGKGKDSIYSHDANDVSILAGDGNDTITVSIGERVYINGGKDADYITVGSGDDVIDVTIEGGEGDDSIFGNNVKNTFVYNSKDGNDTIYGYNTNDVINLGAGVSVSTDSAGSAVTSMTSAGFVVYLTNNKTLTFKGAGDGAGNYAALTGGTNFTFNYSDADTVFAFEVPYQKFIDESTHILDNAEDGYHLIGTGVKDTITSNADNVVIEARGAEDEITVTGGSKVSVNAGEGNDTITIFDGANSATVSAGDGKDLIISNGQGRHVYQYTGGQDTIVGYNENDTIDLGNANKYTTEITENGVLIKVDGSTSKTILLKGQKSDGDYDGSSTLSDYELLAGGTPLNINVKEGASNTTVASAYLGTSGKDIYTASIAGYTVDALAGADELTVSADNVSLNAGIGNDTIVVKEGENVTIFANSGNDLINVTDEANGAGHVFEFRATDGNNTITGFGPNDTIRLTNVTSLKSAQFETEAGKEFFVLTIDDNNKIYLQESYPKAKSDLRNQPFYIQYKKDSVASAYTMADTYILEDTGNANKTWGSSPALNPGAAIISTDKSAEANQITLTADVSQVSVFAGAGNDTIKVEGGSANTIHAGKGADVITLAGYDHVVEYTAGEGNKTINGWDDSDILKITGATSVKTSVDASKNFIVLVGSSKLTFTGIDVNTNVKILYANGIEDNDIFVPKLIIGTEQNDTLLKNIEADFEIRGLGGADTIYNTGDNVTILAGAGTDTIYSSGNNAYIDAGTGNDTVVVADGEKVSVVAGTGDDSITLGADVNDAVIDAGEGNDIIYGNERANIIQYNKNGGNDTILAYNSSNAIHLGTGISIKSTGEGAERVFDTEMTYEGFKINLTNGKSLLLKGIRKTGATGNTIDDFEDLDGDTAINVYEGGSTVANDVIEILTPYEKHLSTAKDGTHTIKAESGTENYALFGTGYADTIVNDGSANVSISSGAGNDLILNNNAEKVSINAGAGDDTIYLKGDDVPYETGSTPMDVDGATENTIYAGKGNDVIYGNANGHVYKFYAYESGTDQDTIYGFTDRDSIYLGNYQDYNGSKKSGSFTGDETDLVDYEFENVTIGGVLDDTKKNVILTINTGKIYIPTLAVDSEIHYAFEAGDGTIKEGTVVVKKEHIMGKGDTIISNNLEGNVITSKGDKADTINNSGDEVSISAGGGADTIYNRGGNVFISAGEGDDTVTNIGDGVIIETGDGKDTIYNTGSDVEINAGFADDTIQIENGYNIVADAGDGADYITIGNGADEVSVKAGAGDDTIDLNHTAGNNVSIYGGEGADLVKNAGDGGVVYVYNTGDGDDTIQYKDGDKIVLALDGNSTFKTEPAENGYLIHVYTQNSSGAVTLDDGKKYDDNTIALTSSFDDNNKSLILNGRTHIDIQVSIGGLEVEGVDDYSPYQVFVTDNEPATLTNILSDYEIVNVGNAAKFIVNTAQNVTISAGDEADTILNNAADALIKGGKGADKIYMAAFDASATDNPSIGTAADVSGVSISGGEGDDTITAQENHNNGIIYMYDGSDTVDNGNDVIVNYSADHDSIYIAGLTEGDYKYTVNSDGEFVVSLPKGSITLKDIKGRDSSNDAQQITFIDDNDNPFSVYAPTVIAATANAENVISTAHAIVNGNSGGDKIKITASDGDVLVNAGAGADSITVAAVPDVSIKTGAGSDTILAAEDRTSNDGIVYIFGDNEGGKLITGVSTKDSIKYTGNNANAISYDIVRQTIEGGSYNELLVMSFGTAANATKVTMKGFEGGDSFTLIDKDDEIQVVKVPRIVPGTEQGETLKNDLDGYEIQAKGGNDTINNSGDKVLITAAAGADSIKNTGAYVSISGGNDNDTITHESGNNSSISGGAGADVINIKAGASGLKVYGGAGNDSIYSENTSGVLYQIYGSADGTDYISGFTTKDTIQIMDSSSLTPLNVSSKASNGNLTLVIGNSKVVIKGNSSDDGTAEGQTLNILNKDGEAITAGATVLKVRNITSTEEPYEVSDNDLYVVGTTSADKINNASYRNVSITSGNGADSINNGGVSASINGGAGKDTITNSASSATIWGGADNDYIENSGSNVVYQFGANEGSDTINGFKLASDSIWLSGVTAANGLPAAIILDADDGTHKKFSFTAATTEINGIADQDILTYAAGDNGKNSMKVYWGANGQNSSEILFTRVSNNSGPITNSSSIALSVGGGTFNDQVITNTNSGVGAKITATQGSKNVTNDAIGTEDKIFKLLTGTGADTITNSGAYASINAGAGDNTITSSGGYATIITGAGNDTINYSGSGTTSINSGNGSDYINLANSTGTINVYTGAGNDTIIAADDHGSSDGNTNTYWFNGEVNEGSNVIQNFDVQKDSFRITSNESRVSITAKVATNNTDISVNITYYGDSTTILLKDFYTNNSTNKLNFYMGKNSTLKEVTVSGLTVSPRIAEEPVAALDDLFADDNYMTNDAQISDITAITQDNYSAGNVETFDLENLTKSSYTPTATYGKDDKNK